VVLYVYLVLRIHHHYIIVYFIEYHYSISGITGIMGITGITGITGFKIKNWAVSLVGFPRGSKPQKVQSIHTYMNSDNFIISYSS